MRWITPLALSMALLVTSASAQRDRWTEAQAQTWQAKQVWPVGGNFLPSTASNQLEMWQKETWDPKTIDRELGWAEQTGMTTMRVFLHDLLWQSDPNGFAQRIDQFLAIADRHHIHPVLVLFDSCWDPEPHLGPQRAPTPGVHNSVWVQGPGVAISDPTQSPRFETYVKGVVSRFKDDPRILAWDVWNEPDNSGGGDYGAKEPKDKVQLVDALLSRVFLWARSAGPTQPLTSGVWRKEDRWDDQSHWSNTERIQLTQSDIISFHNYDWPEDFEQKIQQLLPLNRPILCTEYMARAAGSTIDQSLPVAAKYNVGAINWGLVKGKMQTNLPWDSWQHPYVNQEPVVWFHDFFYPDGKPYRQREADIVTNLTRNKKMWVTSPN
jgi:hypothetical protein